MERIIEGWRNVLTKKADAKSDVSTILSNDENQPARENTATICIPQIKEDPAAALEGVLDQVLRGWRNIVTTKSNVVGPKVEAIVEVGSLKKYFITVTKVIKRLTWKV